MAINCIIKHQPFTIYPDNMEVTDRELNNSESINGKDLREINDDGGGGGAGGGNDGDDGPQTDSTSPSTLNSLNLTTITHPDTKQKQQEEVISNRLQNLSSDSSKEKDRIKGTRGSCRKACGSRSGSGDPEVCQGEDGANRKRKRRRGKPKHRKKPYCKPFSKEDQQRQQNKQPQNHRVNSYPKRLRRHSSIRSRLMKKSGQPTAPYNTTQFLMEDHSDLPNLEQKLADVENTRITSSNYLQKPLGPSRTRDSSFSIDSDEDYFYSSPEDEEEFLTKEFSSAYEDLHAERLSALNKSELIQEYIQLEAKLDLLTKRLKSKNIQTDDNTHSNNKTNGTSPTSNSYSCNIDNDLTKKINFYQQKIDDLIQQNEQLRRDNEALRRTGGRQSPVSSVDSENDSSTSDSSSSDSGSSSPDSCSCSDE